MPYENWSAAEKQIARRVFDEALAAELAQVLAEFKARAAEVSSVGEMWAVEEFLRTRRLAIDQKYDYRYSQLLFLFGRLVRDGRVREDQLTGLSVEKLAHIRRIVTL